MVDLSICCSEHDVSRCFSEHGGTPLMSWRSWPEPTSRVVDVRNLALAALELMSSGHGRRGPLSLEQQIEFVDSHTLKNNYPNPDSFTQNYDATVGSREGRAKSRLNQAFTGNRKLATDLNGKIDIVFSELMRKFDTLRVQIKRLDSWVAENATAIKRQT
ncbi:hypothetical protein F2Q68_00021082 [Brassica cretica]|uniref:Uncharacterized protein n=1 Tax=Brassica cretica TaxID=69181 RepID=A0A8S9FYI8_BRACR|nr:hypothetical protein F2Q68_00021082 [Brassica cretica]